MEKNNKLKICRWRSFLFFLLSVYFLSGCSQHTEIDDDMDQRNAIGFSCTTDDAGTRVSETDINNMEYFRVSAVWHRKDVFLMHNQLVEKTNNGWEYSPTLYWPGQDELSFFAYTPAISKGMTKYDIDKSNRKCTIEYTVDTDADKQEDFMVATALDKTSGPVELEFKHALSLVNFEIQSSDGSRRISKIQLVNLKNEGVLTNTPDGAWTWATSDDSPYVSYSIDFKYPVEITDTYKEVGKMLAVLPQAIDDSQILYPFKILITDEAEKTYDFQPTGLIFQMGKRYTFKITLSAT
ncbi:fimbrillin family protein [Bacteroides sp. 224]|uniref:fimbrillin family protein n=1 Tax=Bacteroides sp. 224 TaxID=2302936 RepID=UPI0013D1D45D|nr:fimbrillin family protein [Bacteroides sp. 224]NDV65607.1 fimbrillin family protein [Bacteroides sp. 224]